MPRSPSRSPQRFSQKINDIINESIKLCGFNKLKTIGPLTFVSAARLQLPEKSLGKKLVRARANTKPLTKKQQDLLLEKIRPLRSSAAAKLVLAGLIEEGY